MSPGAPVLVYMTAGCPYSAAERARLEAAGVAYREIDVSLRPETIPELLKLTRGRRIVPVVVEGGRIRIAPEGGTTF